MSAGFRKDWNEYRGDGQVCRRNERYSRERQVRRNSQEGKGLKVPDGYRQQDLMGEARMQHIKSKELLIR